MTFDPKTTAFLFPGQGSQFVGMGKQLAEAFPAARDVFLEAEDILGKSFLEIMWSGPESVLNDTINTQPALFIHSMAAYRVFQSMFPVDLPMYMAGHSLGELSAIAAAGAISFEGGLRLVRTRGELMKRAGAISPGGMAAVLGLDIPTLEKVCKEASFQEEVVGVANDNCPGQVVISGNKTALERAIIAAKAAGARRALPLAVSIAAHSSLMDSIQSDWENAVNLAGFSNVKIPVIGNVSVTPIISESALRADVIAQMQSRVRWTESVRWMASQGVTTCIEAGAGSVLGGLVKRIAENVVSLPLGNPADFDAFDN